MRMRRKLTIVLSLTVIFFFVHSQIIMALSLGPVEVKSGPGEKFKAVVPIELESTESVEGLVVSLGNARDYSLMGERAPDELAKLHVTLLREGGVKALLYADEPVESGDLNIVLKAVLDGGTMLKKYSLKLGEGLSKAAGLGKVEVRPVAVKPVKAGDTLSNVAASLGYRGADLKRAMVALWMGNRSAFVASNLHGLKKGAVLQTASLKENMTQISAAEARNVISTQWEEWQKIIRARAETIKAAEENKAPGSMSAVPVAVGPERAKAAPAQEGTAKTKAAPAAPAEVSKSIAPQGKAEKAPSPPSVKQAIATAPEVGAGADITAYMGEIEGLRAEVKNLISRLNREIALLQNRLAEQEELAQRTSRKLMLIFFALVGESIALATVLVLTRRRAADRRKYAELRRTGEALSER